MKSLLLILIVSSFIHASDYYKDVDTKLLYTNNKTISVVTQTGSYGGGAHGYTTNYYQNYDKKDGHILTWEMLFQNNEDFFNFIYKQVKNKLANKDYIESFDAKEQRKRLSLFIKVGNFSIQKEGLYIEFPLYTIAPYVYGYRSLLVNKETLKKYLSKISYSNFFH